MAVRLTSMGVIYAVEDGCLDGSYIYRRDFGENPSPDDEGLTLDAFSGLIDDKNRMLKSLLVGKNAVGFIDRGIRKEISFIPEIACEVCHDCKQCFPLCPTSYVQAAFVLVEALTPRS